LKLFRQTILPQFYQHAKLWILKQGNYFKKGFGGWILESGMTKETLSVQEIYHLEKLFGEKWWSHSKGQMLNMSLNELSLTTLPVYIEKWIELRTDRICGEWGRS